MAQNFSIEITLKVVRPLRDVNVSLQLTRGDGIMVIHSANLVHEGRVADACGVQVLTCAVPAHVLNSGTYFLSVGADIPHVRLVFHEQRFSCIRVEASSAEMSRYPAASWKGLVSPLMTEWTLRSECGP